MTATSGIPSTEIDGMFGTMVKAFTRRMFGKAPDSMGVMWHHTAMLKDMMGINRKADKSWLRWRDVDVAEVRDPRAYLVRIVTRQALNQLRTVARRRGRGGRPVSDRGPSAPGRLRSKHGSGRRNRRRRGRPPHRRVVAAAP